jgi:hypothetical protein
MFTTPIQNVVATAASTAFPPSFRTSTPIFEHDSCSLATAPCAASIGNAGVLGLDSTSSASSESKLEINCRDPQGVTAKIRKRSNMSRKRSLLLRRRPSLMEVRFSGWRAFLGSIQDQYVEAEGITQQIRVRERENRRDELVTGRSTTGGL